MVECDTKVNGGRQVQIVQLTAATLHALAGGDLRAANAASPVPLSAYFVDPDRGSLWRRRSVQIREDPGSASWITGAIWDPRRELVVGAAGFHGPPDAKGMVEVGYGVDPAHRRQGYARAALQELLTRAACEDAVTTVRATVSPDNDASSRLILQFGFTEVGEQWDDEDGLEIVYEVAAGLSPS